MRVVEIIFILLVLAVIVGSAGFIASTILDNSARSRRRTRNEQQLAVVAPAALQDAALIPIVINQGKKLQSADAIFAKLVHADIDVFMPEEISTQIKNWQTLYEKEK